MENNLEYSDIAIYTAYGLKCLWTYEGETKIVGFKMGDSQGAYLEVYTPYEDIKPLLRPMLDMTEEERSHLINIGLDIIESEPEQYLIYHELSQSFSIYNYLAKQRLDFQDLIGQGKALNIKDYE